LNWIDIGTFYRNRQNVVPLNSAVYLTRGNPAGTTALFAHFAPAHRSFIGILEEKDTHAALIGQVEAPSGQQSARLTFYFSRDDQLSEKVPALLEGLVKQAVVMGATNVTADMEENHPAVDTFRRCGFSVYARQRIWRIPSEIHKPLESAGHWRDFNEMDHFYIQSLYQSLVPPMVQRVEGFAHDQIQGLVYLEHGERYGYVDCQYGLQGIFLQPYIHPEVENIHTVFQQLLVDLPSIFDRPVYFAVRSYQAWLERDLEDLGATASETRIMLVKHMGLQNRASVKDPLWGVVEQTNPQASVTSYHSALRK
jgi:hypothetical protein